MTHPNSESEGSPLVARGLWWLSPRPASAALLLFAWAVCGCGGRTVSGIEETAPLAAAPSASGSSPSPAGEAGRAGDYGAYGSSGASSGGVYGGNYPPRPCAGLDTACDTDAECCAGTFCDNLGYSFWTCTPLRPDGGYCMAHSHCQSGLCQNYACTSNACGEPGAPCGTDADCCAGSFCDLMAYANPQSQCRAALPGGSHCTDDRSCQSGHCLDYACSGS